MIMKEQAQELHDKASRGELLSAEERSQLDTWYVAQDAAETQDLGLAKDNDARIRLQTQIDNALSQLTNLTQHIQQVASENEALRREITNLRQQVAHFLVPLSA